MRPLIDMRGLHNMGDNINWKKTIEIKVSNDMLKHKKGKQMNDQISAQMAEAQAQLDVPAELKRLPEGTPGKVFVQTEEQVGEDKPAE